MATVSASSSLEWDGDAARAQVFAALNQQMLQMGTFIVSRMQQYAPVKTGMLRAGIHDQFDPTNHVLIVHVPAPYSVYVEFGTRYMRPHPFARPAILDAAAVWPISHVEFVLHPLPQKSEPLIASASGFRLPQHQKLTPQQEAHVRTHLIPTSRKLAARYKRRGVKLTVRKYT